MTDQEIEKIQTRLQSAFAPLRCVAEVWDYKQKLRFKVFDNNDQGIIEVPSIVLRDLGNESFFQNVIE